MKVSEVDGAVLNGGCRSLDWVVDERVDGREDGRIFGRESDF